MGQGSQVAGVVGSSNTNFSGNYGYGSMSGNSNSFGTASVVRAPTANAAATIVMFRANEPGAQGAFEAEQVQTIFAVTPSTTASQCGTERPTRIGVAW